MNIIGRLTKDAQVSKTANGREVVNFSIAVNDSYKNKEGQRIELTEYVDCSYWLTPKVAPWLIQGLLVELSGRISARAWTGKDGNPKAGLSFHTSAIKPLAKPAQENNDQTVQASDETKQGKAVQNSVATEDDEPLPF